MKGGEGLGTIFEEIDLSERIQSLKGKKIRIKRMVRKEDGSYSLKESFVQAEADRPRPPPAVAAPPAAAPRRFRSTDRRAAPSRDMRLSVFYERLAGGGAGGERLSASQSSIRQSLSLSRALCFEEDEAVRLPPLAAALEAGLGADEEALELSRRKAKEDVQAHFDALIADLAARVRATRDRLCARIDAYYQRLRANTSGFARLLADFREEESCVSAADRSRAATICKSFRICDGGRLLREEPVNALWTIPRVRLEGLKRVLAFAAEKWASLGSGYCAFAAGETAREAAAEEARTLAESVRAGLGRLEELYHESELRDISAFNYRAELEPLTTPARHALIHNSAPCIRPAVLVSASTQCFGVSDRLIAWTSSAGALRRFSLLRGTFEQVACPDSFSALRLQVFACYPPMLRAADPPGTKASRRDHLLLHQLRASQHSLVLFDPATAIAGREWELSAAPASVLPLKDGFSFAVVCDRELSFFSLEGELPLQVVALPAGLVSWHLSAGLTLIYVVLNDQSVATVQLAYAYNPKCGRVVLREAEVHNIFPVSEPLLEVSELTLRSGCLLALCASGGLQLLSAESLEPMETVPLPLDFTQMRLLENPLELTTHVFLLSRTHVGLFDFNRKQVLAQQPLSLEHAYGEVNLSEFALLPTLQLIFTAQLSDFSAQHLLAVSIEP